MSEGGRVRHRFAVFPDAVQGEQVRFTAGAARQMRRVLRLRPGDRVAAFDGSGLDYTVVLASLSGDDAVGTIESEKILASEPSMPIVLCQALLPRDKYEVVLQKGTEVGATGFQPLVTERSQVPGGSIDDRRLERWQAIVREAAEQSGRAVVPRVSSPLRLPEALLHLAEGGPTIMAWEREPASSLRPTLVRMAPEIARAGLTVFVGPEGGFSQSEVESARAAGAETVSLGPRILRAETAGPVLVALALYELGEPEPPG